MVDPPPLPPRLTRVSTVIGLGTLLWIAAAAVAALADAPGLVVLTCAVGAGLGAGAPNRSSGWAADLLGMGRRESATILSGSPI